MQTKAVRLYGKNDLRLEEFDLPEIANDEILADVTSSSICMSSYKMAIQGPDHKRVPIDIYKNPVIVGHEFCGTILQIGKKWHGKFSVGDKYCIQPMLCYPGRELEAIGYSYKYSGGHATKIIIPSEVMEMNYFLPYKGDAFFKASLAEPLSCIIGAFNNQYHFRQNQHIHKLGIVENGSTLILGGAGPMGLAAIDYAIHGPRRPSRLVITDINQQRLDKAAQHFTVDTAKKHGVDLHYVNTSGGEIIHNLLAINKGKGYDDTFVFTPVSKLVEQASQLLGYNGCLNFFAGPANSDFSASINFFDVHYSEHHIVGSSGGNAYDLKIALDLIENKTLNPAVMITHIGGIDAAAKTIKTLPEIPGGKKLIYPHISMPLTAIDSFKELGKNNSLFADLSNIIDSHNGLWSFEAEKYLLANTSPKTMIK